MMSEEGVETAKGKEEKCDNDDIVIHKSKPPFPLYVDPDNATFEEGFASVAGLLRGKRNILVLAGAGISVSCGIPDFRSPQGLYSTLDAKELGLGCPEDLFDLQFFLEDPRPFFRFAVQNNLYPSSPDHYTNMKPSTSHKFLSFLEQHNMLLRVYTQNIDGLEQVAGLSSEKVEYAHGSLQWAECTRCHARMESSEITPHIFAGTVPYCQLSRPPPNNNKNKNKKTVRAATKARRTQTAVVPPPRAKRIRRSTFKQKMANDYGEEGTESSSHCNTNPGRKSSMICGGVIKPGVTFFGEKLNDQVGKRLEADHAKADALIVMGTSLSVAPMSKVIQYLPRSIPRILINRNMVYPPITASEEEDDDDEEEDFRTDGRVFDACLLGYCDDVTRNLVKELNTNHHHQPSTTTSSPPAMSSQTLSHSNSSRSTSTDTDNDGGHRHGPSEEGTLLSLAVSSEESESLLEHNKTQLIRMPHNRVFLFPGAMLQTSGALQKQEEDMYTHTEVAHCDGCQDEIVSPILHKCSQCFDFDLCQSCYPSVSIQHCNGKHTFIMESRIKPTMNE